MRRRALALALAATTLAPGVRAQAAPQQVQLGGVMGGRALLVIDGQPQMLAVGASARGVRLVSLKDDVAQVDIDGRLVALRVGGTPVALVGGAGAPAAAREIVIPAGPGGHFTTDGTINGRSVTFMVDTGATTIAMGQADAARIGLDLRNAPRGISGTANGTVPVLMVTLTNVRVGGIEVVNVPAVVMPAQMPYVLLGNSFLSRFQMRRENDVMRLEPRR